MTDLNQLMIFALLIYIYKSKVNNFKNTLSLLVVYFFCQYQKYIYICLKHNTKIKRNKYFRFFIFDSISNVLRDTTG